MKVHSIKTDNANVSHKVELRKLGTKNLKELNVLDLFAGNNILWSHFDCKKYYGIEKEKGKGRNLNADNVRVLKSLDLLRFNVIDCDSYGIPAEQISLLFQNLTLQKGTIIFYTAIGSAMSGLSNTLLNKFNLSVIYKKNKTLLNKKSHELFYAMLNDYGVKSVVEYTEPSAHFLKNYGYFIV